MNHQIEIKTQLIQTVMAPAGAIFLHVRNVEGKVILFCKCDKSRKEYSRQLVTLPGWEPKPKIVGDYIGAYKFCKSAVFHLFELNDLIPTGPIEGGL